MTKVNQDELPFDDGGYTQPRDVLLALYEQAKASRQRRLYKPNTRGIDLNQPLLAGLVFDAEREYAYTGDAKEGEVKKSDQPEGREAWEKLGSKGPNSEFSRLPTTEEICKIAAKLLYGQLDILMYSSGNAEVKQEIIDWVFAERFVFADGHVAKKSLRNIPFTAQFCCAVEEIDYDLLCEALHIRIDKMREAQEARALKAQQRTGTQNEKIHQGTFSN